MLASGPVTRAAKFLVVLALLAIVPLRGFAAVTIGFCAIADPLVAAAQAQAEDDHAAHPHGEAPDQDFNAECNACAEHCTSASVLLPALPVVLATAMGDELVALPGHFVAGHVPEQLDPPPLAL